MKKKNFAFGQGLGKSTRALPLLLEPFSEGGKLPQESSKAKTLTRGKGRVKKMVVNGKQKERPGS